MKQKELRLFRQRQEKDFSERVYLPREPFDSVTLDWRGRNVERGGRKEGEIPGLGSTDTPIRVPYACRTHRGHGHAADTPKYVSDTPSGVSCFLNNFLSSGHV